MVTTNLIFDKIIFVKIFCRNIWSKFLVKANFWKYLGFATDCIQLYEIPPSFRHINLNQEEFVGSQNKSDFIKKN